ncbi:MAG TPA: SDR family NAD(P)-dependent oxidoreductase, partial [Candidatus Methylacidiphilales bacterium]
THAFLPPMLARGRGRILNTASIAGFYPAPTLAVYHASKAFVLSFSEALATELEGSGITVTALCPGATDTDFFVEGEMVDTKIFQQGNVAAPQDVAAEGYDALMRGERVYVHGGLNKVLAFLQRVLPESARAKAMESLYAKTDEIKRGRGSVEQKATRRETSPRGLGLRPGRTSKE